MPLICLGRQISGWCAARGKETAMIALTTPSGTPSGKAATAQLHELGQSLWLDYITRGLLTGGTLEHYLADLSVTGLTSNPTIFDRAISQTTDYDALIQHLGHERTPEDVFFDLAMQDLECAADLFRPIHDSTAGADGWVSMEVSPLLAYDASKTLVAARFLHARAARTNLFIKIPGTPQCLPAVEGAIFAGVPINVTLLFSPEQYLAAADAYMRALERRVAAGLSPSVGSVASLFVSRWDKAVETKAPQNLRNRLGIAIAKKTYCAYRQLLDSPRWQRLENAGARPQRLLFASTSTKDPQASDLLYVESLAAPNTINTMPEDTLLALADHGRIGQVLTPDSGDADTTLAEFARLGVNVDTLAATLQHEGVDAFTKSWYQLLAQIQTKASHMVEHGS